jgi:hypothetical protein
MSVVERRLTYEVIKADDLPGEQWAVQAWDDAPGGDGEGYFALFYGHDAERRAREYAGLMNALCRAVSIATGDL